MKNTSVTPSATLDQMPSPSHSAKIGASASGEPLHNLAADIDRVGEEERRQQDAAEQRDSGEDVPHRQRNDRDQQLQRQQRQARHQPASACEDCA
jgi:hypothetical protein